MGEHAEAGGMRAQGSLPRDGLDHPARRNSEQRVCRRCLSHPRLFLGAHPVFFSLQSYFSTKTEVELQPWKPEDESKLLKGIYLYGVGRYQLIQENLLQDWVRFSHFSFFLFASISLFVSLLRHLDSEDPPTYLMLHRMSKSSGLRP